MLDDATIQRTLATALRTGGEFAEVFVEDKRSSSAMLDDGRVEELSSGRDRGAGIRVVVGETTGLRPHRRPVRRGPARGGRGRGGRGPVGRRAGCRRWR